MSGKVAQISLPPKIVRIFEPKRGEVQYRGAYGGRGSGKSFSFAKMAAIWGYCEPLRFLCAREFQASIKESFHAELKAAIASVDWLADHYDVGVDYLRGRNGTEFIFKGLRHNIGSIKSLAKIDVTILEEAEDIPAVGWTNLKATVLRNPKSEIWVIWNPKTQGSPVDDELRKNPPDNSIVVKMNWNDNPFFPSGLDQLRRNDLERLDPNMYAHIWEGEYLTNSDAQVFANKYRIAEFDISEQWDGPYQGGDFGFSQDPTAAVRCYIHDDVLYISDEAYQTKLELDHTVSFINSKIPRFEEYVTRWDSARPESISYLKRHGFPKSQAVKKWKGSVEDGVQFMRSFKEIVIHARCKNLANEFRLYSYKVDSKSGDIMPDIIDAHNHGCIAKGELVHCERGNIPIENVTKQDRVMTRNGFKQVLFAGETGRNLQTLEIKTNIGKFRCTPDHKVWTQRGFIEARLLKHGDIVTSLGVDRWLNASYGMTRRIADILKAIDGQIGNTLSAHTEADQNISTETYGDSTMGRYQKVIKFTIKTVIQETIPLKTWNAFYQKTMHHGIHLMQIGCKNKKNTLIELGILQRRGMQVMKDEKSMLKLEGSLIRTLSLKKSNVSIVSQASKQKSLGTSTSFAAMLAKAHSEDTWALIMKSDNVQTVGKISQPINTVKPKTVQGFVLSVSDAGLCDQVFDLTVEDEHEYFVNGILVHNCDAVRYALTPLMKVTKKQQTASFGNYGRTEY